MSSINESYVIQQYVNGHSTIVIAKELNTYPKKIERILKRHGQSLRSKSESQALAIKKGRSKHPTEGSHRTEEHKIKISKGAEQRWKNMSKQDRQSFIDGAKDRWDKMPADRKREMLEKAGRSLQRTTKEGSKAEKFLRKKLLDEGYDVRLHVKNLVEGKFEIDLFLPELKLIIEIDGPQHFVPIFGEKRLEEVIKFDSIKNGLLISKGFCVIRIRYLCKHMSQSVQRKLWTLVSNQVEKIKDKFPSKKNRFIELEID
jgi:very-short-patch-repair endonuclease